jgi:hypothetical protein
VDQARCWPVFVVVVGERDRGDIRSAAPLLDMVERWGGSAPAVIPAASRWSIVDNRNAVLRVQVRADVPRRFTADILLSARRVLGVLDVVARGGTIGITTARHMAHLSGRVDIGTALQRVVQLSCGASAELARIADLLQRTARGE